MERIYVQGATQQDIDKKLELEKAKALLDNTVRRINMVAKVGRNDPCPCGAVDANGKPIKFKRCCIKKAV